MEARSVSCDPCRDPRRGTALRDIAKTAANRVLIEIATLDASEDVPAAHEELLRWGWPRHREALESQLIDEESFTDLQAARSDAEKRRATAAARFFERRSARIRALVSRFIARRAGLGVPRLLPVDVYYDDEAHGDAEPPAHPAP